MSTYFAERAAVTPLRLTPLERSKLRVLEGALAVSEYTDKVDVVSFRQDKGARIQQQLGDMLAVMSGLTVSSLPKQGHAIVQGRSFSDNAAFFAEVFEIGRRFKIMNPDEMRATHGKLLYMLQDTELPEIRRALRFSCVRPILTVQAELEQMGALGLLEDGDLPLAVAPVLPGDEAARKAEAAARLVARYGGEDEALAPRLERVLLSIGDDEALTLAHVRPVERMLALLQANFDPREAGGGHSLQISSGRNGARLSHSHAAQYAYVHQSLCLWREILSRLSHTWSLAEADLLEGAPRGRAFHATACMHAFTRGRWRAAKRPLAGEHRRAPLASGSGYRLRDTGQGMHRVQGAPRVGRFMQAVLVKLQAEASGGWVGSSAVHLGDNDVPNALVWIDKYTQVRPPLAPC